MVELFVKVWLCGIAAMLVMGAGGLLRSLVGAEGPSIPTSDVGGIAPDFDESAVDPASMTRMRRRLFDALAGQVTDLLYYDRKEDDYLPLGAIEDLVARGAVTVEEMVGVFDASLREGHSSTAVPTSTDAMKQKLYNCVSDIVIDLMYYDRKEDDVLPRGAIEHLLATETVTLEQIVAAFESSVRDGLSEKNA